LEDFEVFLSLGKALYAAGWNIVKFEHLGGGARLEIIPLRNEKKAEDAE
jgi:hypothetical protein